MKDYSMRFDSIKRLYGQKALKSIRDAHVAVIGLGGVGSWSVEALVRSGIGNLSLVDKDEICLSNINRQIHATSDTVNRSKAIVLKERSLSIAPECKVSTFDMYYNITTSKHILSYDFDYIIDAIDSVEQKCLLISECINFNKNLVTCGGAGGKKDPKKLKFDDLSKTKYDPLLLQVRKKLRKVYGFPNYGNKSFGIKCLYSEEKPQEPKCDFNNGILISKSSNHSFNCDYGFGSSTMMTGTMGFLLADYVISQITNIK